MKRIFLLTVMGCYLAFAYLLYHRWLVAEAIHGGAVHFEDLLGNGNGSVCAPVAVVKPVAAIVRDAPGGAPSVAAASCRELHQISWLSVMLPLWIADALTLSAHSALLIVQHTWRPAATSFNARLEHASGACRAVLYALFKVLLLEELTNPGSPTALSWWLIFAPIYSAAVLQAIFHSFKTLEGGEALFRCHAPKESSARLLASPGPHAFLACQGPRLVAPSATLTDRPTDRRTDGPTDRPTD